MVEFLQDSTLLSTQCETVVGALDLVLGFVVHDSHTFS
jgi:hypothetical protein